MKFREVKNNKIINLAGGIAYTQSPELELLSLLLTSFVEDQYYSKASDQLERLKQLIYDNKDIEFIAKAIIYARREFGLRSITHAAIVELLPYLRETPKAYNIVKNVIHRPDDILEIVAYYLKDKILPKVKRGLPNALRKGINLAIAEFDEYKLAKYRGEKSTVKMVDIFNLTHPKPKDAKQSELFKKLMTGQLKSTQTWESKLTKAGQVGETEDEVKELKGQAWKELLINNKLGYFALLRNLRNIIEQSPDCVDLACEQLTSEKEIKRSLVFPFRFTTAYEALNSTDKSHIVNIQKVKLAIDKAADIALNNVPKFDGWNAIAIDVSGSMGGKPIEIASLFAAALLKVNPTSHLLLFSDNCQYALFDPRMPLIAFADAIKHKAIMGGTNFHSIFTTLTMAYDRIIVLSDMQPWIYGHETAQTSLNTYKQRFNCNPFVYSFDLQGYGSMQFKDAKTLCIAGFSDKIFNVIKLLEQDRNALLNTIRNYEIK